MDALAGLLDGVRARGAFVRRLSFDPPWSLRIADDAPVTLICQIRGDSVIVTGDDELWLAPGDIALARSGRPYLFAGSPGTAPSVVIHPGQRCTTPEGVDLKFDMAVGTRTWGNSADGANRCVIGAYEGHSAVSARLLDALPPVAAIRAADWDSPLVELSTAPARRPSWTDCWTCCSSVRCASGSTRRRRLRRGGTPSVTSWWARRCS